MKRFDLIALYGVFTGKINIVVKYQGPLKVNKTLFESCFCGFNPSLLTNRMRRSQKLKGKLFQRLLGQEGGKESRALV